MLICPDIPMKQELIQHKSIAIIGPTACGKTRRAVEIAREFNGEILSADSRQVYRRMDIGTGKDLNEYAEIPYHLIDICEPGTKYNLYQYLRDFRAAYDGVARRGRLPVICGGSGMYVENALAGVYLPEVPENQSLRNSLKDKTLEELTSILKKFKTLHNTTDVDTSARAIRAIEIQEYYRDHPDAAAMADIRTAQPLDCIIIGLDISREQRRKRISCRLEDRLAAGMIEEINELLDSGLSADDLIYYGLEYKFVTLYVTGQLSRQEMQRQLEIAIHQFAKRQMTWFRGMERRGFRILWVPYDISSHELLQIVEENISSVKP